MKTITTKELKKIFDVKTEESIIIDVRTKNEHMNNHIPDVLNIPLDEIENHQESLLHYKAVYLHCHSGGRSNVACNKLFDAGLHNVVNVLGGISDWENNGFPTIKKEGARSQNKFIFWRT